MGGSRRSARARSSASSTATCAARSRASARWPTRALRGRQTLKAGVEFIDNMKQDQVATYIGAPGPFLATDRSSKQLAVFVQDEIKLGRWIIVNGGLRYDHYEEFSRVTPRAALIGRIKRSAINNLRFMSFSRPCGENFVREKI